MNYYYISDFTNLTGSGNKRHAACPECKSNDNVSLDIENGLVHCFTPGCKCSGVLIDKDRPAGTELGEAAEEDKDPLNPPLRGKHAAEEPFAADSSPFKGDRGGLLLSHYPKTADEVCSFRKKVD